MKFTLSWLKEHLDTFATLQEITDKLTAIGLEVEGIDDPAKTLQGFVVGHVEECTKHPDADKLQCLIVNTGKEKLKVVCGAPNAKLGMKGVFAPVGSYIPGSDMTLKKGNIRGQESCGMMCSERELLLSDEHKGIIELPDAAVTGSPAAEALGLNDPVIEINLTPNRGDCAGVYGIARDLAAAGIGKLKPLKMEAVAGKFKSPVTVNLKDSGCPHFIGRYIKGVKNGPSPKWLQDRLKSIGQKPISALVDITNYMTIGLNRPLHVFDAEKLKGDIHVRMSKQGEKLEALNDKAYDLDGNMIAVCDDRGVLGLGGVIGGVPSSVSDETKNVYLEVAYFDQNTVARTGRALQIDSDARYRFERGIDPAFTAPGAEISTKMILDLCGGEASEIISAGHAPDVSKTVSYPPQKLQALGGSALPEAKQKEILTALGFSVSEGKGTWNIKTPSWRHDIEGAADIVEEILRIDGYDNIPEVPVAKTREDETGNVISLDVRRSGLSRRILALRGLYETVTWSFMDDKKFDLFGGDAAAQKPALTISNPISEDLAVMRPSILPNLIDAAGRNADRGIADAALFEIGSVYHSSEYKGQVLTAAGIRSGNIAARHWAAPARAVDALDAKGDALAVLETCGVNPASLQITTDAPEWYHPGRSGVLRLGRTALAYFGEIHPMVLDVLKRDEHHAGFEVFLQNIPAPKSKGTRKALLKLSALQPLTRDFAFIVDQALEAEKLLRIVRAVDKNLIVGADIFDVYAGKGIEPGKKSVAVAVTLQPVEKTLTDEEIAALCQKIIEAAKQQAGATLRT